MTQITGPELDAALANVLAAPKDNAVVEQLCLRPQYGERNFVEQIELTRDHGIPGERWSTRPWLRLLDGAPDPAIQVCILGRRVLDLVWQDRENTPHPGDSFIVDMDLSEANLPTGQLLRVGSAILQVSGVFNDGCVKWKARYGEPAWSWVRAPEHRALRLRGILCSVHRDGLVRNGDKLAKFDGS